MYWPPKNVFASPNLDDLSRMHHCNPVGKLQKECRVVADQENCSAVHFANS